MILSWMVYGSVLTLLLALAAMALEGVVRQRGWPVRGLWITALSLALTLPFLLAGEPETPPEIDAVPQSRPAASQVEASTGLPASVAVVPVIRMTRLGQEQTLDGLRLDGWLLRGWASATTLLALGTLLSWLTLSRRRRQWRQEEVDGRGILVSTDTGPAVAGMFRGKVVLPEWLMIAPAGDRTLALLHEEEHLRARDPALLFGSMVLSILLPWNAPLWWLGTRLRRAVEIDCDLRVLAQGADPMAYSRLLVNVMNRGNAHRLMVGALSETPSFLERRIRHMLDSGTPGWRLRASRASILATVCVVAACRVDQPQEVLAPAAIATADLGDQIIDSRVAASTSDASSDAGSVVDDEVTTAASDDADARGTDPVMAGITEDASGTMVQLISQGSLNPQNFRAFALAELRDAMENGVPQGEAMWLAVDASGTVQKRWMGPDLFIHVPDSLDPRSPARPAGTPEDLAVKEAHHRAFESVLHANAPGLALQSVVTLLWGPPPSYVVTIVSESPARNRENQWSERRPVNLAIRTTQAVTTTPMPEVEQHSLAWRGEEWVSLQERIIQPGQLHAVGEVDGEAIFSEVGAEDPQVLFQMVSAPDLFRPFVRE